VLVTCRSWYALPGPSKRAQRRLKEFEHSLTEWRRREC
jgi:hypothetical protein